MAKIKIAVLFGGQSSEHEISCISGITVLSNLDTALYEIHRIGITQDGRWLMVSSTEEIKNGTWRKSKASAVLSPDAGHGGLIIMEGNHAKVIPIDVVFPVLHGFYGEDGTVQGLLELSRIPFVGCGVLASSVGMDKLHTKLVIQPLHIRQAKYAAIKEEDLDAMDATVGLIEGKLNYPMFIKPSNAGSSKGISKVRNRTELEHGLREAANHDKKILVEESIFGREVECAVMGGRDVVASPPGEIIAAAEFYDYDAKYNNKDSQTILRPNFPNDTKEQIREFAIRIYKAVDGYGLARVDFFVEEGTNEVVFNEINTLPGFTEISMYPMLMKESGYELPELINQLVKLALERPPKGGRHGGEDGQ